MANLIKFEIRDLDNDEFVFMGRLTDEKLTTLASIAEVLCDESEEE